MTDMQLVILLLALFGIKHFICDFVLQFDYMVKQKGTYCAPGGVHHAWLHGAFTFLVLCWFYPLALWMGAIDFIAHYHIDWAKQQLNKGLTTADRMFWVWFGADQALHYLTYIAIIGYIVT
jgi:hypothetical protein